MSAPNKTSFDPGELFFCCPSVKPSICRLPLSRGQLFWDLIWSYVYPCPWALNLRASSGWVGQLKSAHCGLNSAKHRLQNKGQGNAVLTQTCCDAHEFRSEVCGGVLSQYVGVLGKGGVGLKFQYLPPTKMIPFASNHQTRVGLNTHGRSPGGTKPPAWIQTSDWAPRKAMEWLAQFAIW